MTTEARALLEQALRLDAVQRAELIDALFRSFEGASSRAHAAAWAAEAESRIDACDAGKLTADPAEKALDRVSRR